MNKGDLTMAENSYEEIVEKALKGLEESDSQINWNSPLSLKAIRFAIAESRKSGVHEGAKPIVAETIIKEAEKICDEAQEKYEDYLLKFKGKRFLVKCR